MREFAARRRWREAPGPRWFRRVFTSEECARIVSGYGTGDRKRSLHGSEERSTRDTDVRWILAEDPAAEWIYARLAAMVARWNGLGFHFDLVGTEGLQLARYGRRQHYDWHFDFGPTEGNWRKLSMVVLLSRRRDFAGGDLQFLGEQGPFSHPLGIGDAVVFPAWAKHRVTPVADGDRWSLTSWYWGPPFR